MLNLNLTEENRVSFQLGIIGTSSTPSQVRLFIVGTGLSLCFNGTCIAPNTWAVDIPAVYQFENFLSSSAQIRVEVVLNNRVFVPIVKDLTIGSSVDKGGDVQIIQTTQEPVRTEVPSYITKQDVIDAYTSSLPISTEPAEKDSQNLDINISNSPNAKIEIEIEDEEKVHAPKSDQVIRMIEPAQKKKGEEESLKKISGSIIKEESKKRVPAPKMQYKLKKFDDSSNKRKKVKESIDNDVSVTITKTIKDVFASTPINIGEEKQKSMTSTNQTNNHKSITQKYPFSIKKKGLVEK